MSLRQLVEVGRVFSRKNEAALKSALATITDLLAKVTKSKEAIQPLSFSDRSRALCDATEEKLGDGCYCWVADVFDTWYVYSCDGEMYRADYTLNPDNTVTIGEPTPVTAQVVYTEEPPDPAEPGVMAESVTTDAAPLPTELREANVNLKLIAPGWGSTAYYPAAILERDGPRTFTRGTKMYWNHQTMREEAERPEGSLNDLAAELVTDARWDSNGPQGAGLYATAKVFEKYAPAVKDLKDHIGVSIRAMGLSKAGEREGRTGPILERLLSARSVDFVTVPGAGGKVLEMFEAARSGRQIVREENVSMSMTEDQLRELREAKAAAATAQANIESLRAEMQLISARESARGIARAHLAGVQIAEPVRLRVVESALRNVAVKGGELDVVAFTEAVKAELAKEQAYLESLGFGGVKQQGASGAAGAGTATVTEQQLAESFASVFGMSAEAAKMAAAGREEVQ